MTCLLYSRLNNGKGNALKRTTAKNKTKKKAFFRKSLFFSLVEISRASLRVRISPNLSKPLLHQQMDGVNCIFPFFFPMADYYDHIMIFLFLRRWCCTHLLAYFKNRKHISTVVFHDVIIWTFISSCICLRISLNIQIFLFISPKSLIRDIKIARDDMIYIFWGDFHEVKGHKCALL